MVDNLAAPDAGLNQAYYALTAVGAAALEPAVDYRRQTVNEVVHNIRTIALGHVEALKDRRENVAEHSVVGLVQLQQRRIFDRRAVKAAVLLYKVEVRHEVVGRYQIQLL